MHTLRWMVCGVAIGSMGLTAAAQDAPPKPERPAVRQPRPEEPPRAGPREQMPPEKAKAAWALEATGVSKRVGASDDQAKAVVKVYTEARESQAMAADKMRQEQREKARQGGGDDGGGRAGPGNEGMKAMEEMNAKEREKLQKSLGATLSADQTTKAMASLGTFNRQWDQMADAIAGFGLEGAKQQEALNAIEDFVIAQGKIRPGAGAGGGDREAVRSAMQESRQKLNETLKKALSAEQFAKFEETTRGGRGPGGPGGPRGGRPERGGDEKGGGGGG